ncbi:MAG: hypothetical protein ACRENB_17040 [Gemmatimonadales bacterium]
MLRAPPWAWAVLVTASPALAQRPPTPPPITRIATPPVCSTCRLTLTTTLRLGADTGVTFHDLGYTATRDSRGRLFFTGFGTEGAVTVYDPGSRRAFTLGRRGRGPGEFISPAFALAGKGDTIFVWDDAARRISVFGPDLRFVRSFPLGGFRAQRGIVLDSGELILSGHGVSAGAVGSPLLRVHPARGGGGGTAFGGEGGVVRPEQWMDQSLELGRAKGGRVWSGRINRYLLTLWSAEGRPVKRIERQAPWFASREGADPRTEVAHAGAALVGLWEDGQGLVWTTSVVPAERKIDISPASHRERGAPERLSHEVLLERLDTMIEAIDPVRGQVVVSRRVRGPLVPGGSPGTLLRLTMDDQGREFLELVQVGLLRGGR